MSYTMDNIIFAVGVFLAILAFAYLGHADYEAALDYEIKNQHRIAYKSMQPVSGYVKYQTFTENNK